MHVLLLAVSLTSTWTFQSAYTSLPVEYVTNQFGYNVPVTWNSNGSWNVSDIPYYSKIDVVMQEKGDEDWVIPWIGPVNPIVDLSQSVLLIQQPTATQVSPYQNTLVNVYQEFKTYQENWHDVSHGTAIRKRTTSKFTRVVFTELF